MANRLLASLGLISSVLMTTSVSAQEQEGSRYDFRFGVDYWGAKTEVEQGDEKVLVGSAESSLPFSVSLEHPS